MSDADIYTDAVNGPEPTPAAEPDPAGVPDPDVVVKSPRTLCGESRTGVNLPKSTHAKLTELQDLLQESGARPTKAALIADLVKKQLHKLGVDTPTRKAGRGSVRPKKKRRNT